MKYVTFYQKKKLQIMIRKAFKTFEKLLKINFEWKLMLN